MSRFANQKGKRATYPAYKPSGVPWLGDVPQHWDVDRAKWTVADCRNGIWGEEPDGINDLPCVRVADFDRTAFRVRIDDPTMRAVTPNERRGRLLQNGDLLLEKSGGGDLQPVGAVMQYDHDVEAVCANFIARMPVAPGYASRFLAYLHAHLNAGRVNTRSIKQTTGIQNIDSQQYLNEAVAHPPLDEQQAIAAFLDRETARIDALIERKRRQIELLQEKRSALINHAVTKGLDSHAPMKDSGVEWFGDVPEHWSPVRLRYRAKINSSRSELDGTPGTLDISFVPMESVHEYGGLSLDQTRPLAEVATGYTYFRDGDVLAAKITPCFENGKGSIAQDLVNGIGCGTTELHVLRPYASLGRRFLFYVTISHAFRHLGAGEMYGAGGQKRVPEDFFRNFRQPIPPLAEQRAIAAFLDRETARIDGLIEKVEQSIATLREHRTALISAAVTGKIDVRGEVA